MGLFGRLRMAASAFTIGNGAGSHFDAAGRGRRLSAFNAPKAHINKAISKAGPTLVARARWLYENDGYAGNAVDEWTSAAVGDGIKPRPRKTKMNRDTRSELLDLFWRWTEEADSEGITDYYGLQERVARECYMAGECFVRIRPRRPGDMRTVPFQLQVLPTEMLDLHYNESRQGGGFIRCGVEFNAIGKRVAYHFWREHPYDDQVAGRAYVRDRVRVPAEQVIHVFDGRQGGQIRGVPRVARVLVKLFMLEAYDDAELERKRTAALFTAFRIGRGESPLEVNDDDEDDDGDDQPWAPMEPGAIIDLGDDSDVRFSTPSEVGGSYEAFQYRNLTKIAAGLGVPYAYMTGDTSRGNFSNVRTDIIRFRRRVSQWQNNTLIFQLCRAIWSSFVEYAVLSGKIDLPGYDEDPSPYWAAEHLPPRQEWIDPAKDIKAEKEAVDAGFKTRTQVIAERGYDREDIDEELADEQAAVRDKGIKLGSAAAKADAAEQAAEAARADREEREDEGAAPANNGGDDEV